MNFESLVSGAVGKGVDVEPSPGHFVNGVRQVDGVLAGDVTWCDDGLRVKGFGGRYADRFVRRHLEGGRVGNAAAGRVNFGKVYGFVGIHQADA